jgi:sugar lactone lactonase YvrE
MGISGHTASGNVIVKVDHTSPEVALSGSLAEQGSVGTRRPTYALRVNASDGAEGAPQSGVKKVEVRVDGKKVPMAEESEWEPDCQTQDCRFGGEWSMIASEYGAGQHEVQVIATDAVDNVTTKTLQVELHPAPPALSVSGTLTERATLGTELPAYDLRIDASARAESPVPTAIPTYSSSFGTAGTGNGQFSRLGSMTMSPFGNLIVVDTGNNRVQTFSPKGEFGVQFGTKGSGNGQLNRPTAIATAANGNYWVTDSGNRRVEEFASGTGAYLGQFGSAGTGNGQFAGSGPEAIAIDAHGNIWVADTYGGRLEKFDENGQFIRSVATRGKGPGQLLQPDGIAIAPGGNVFVTDWENDKVVEYGEGGAFIRQFGSEGNEPGQLENPTGIAIDGRGDVWVADQNNSRIEEFNQAGEYLGRFGARGSGAGQFELSYPTGIVTDSSGDIWVTDTGDDRIEKWVSAGYTTSTRPSYVSSFGSPGTKPCHFSNPHGVAVDPDGDIWTADPGSNLVQKWSPNGACLATYPTAGTGATWAQPVGLAISNGHVWVSDIQTDHIVEVSETDALLSTFGTPGTGPGQLDHPYGIAFDSNHHLWVSEFEGDRVQEFTEAGSLIRTVGSAGTGTGHFEHASGIAVGPGNKVWVADFGNGRVEEFSETGAFLREIGGPGSGVGRLAEPMGVYVDAAEHIWVADRGHHRIVEFNGTGEFLGSFGLPGTGPGGFEAAEYITADPGGHLWVSDAVGDRISEWTAPALHSQISTEITIDGKQVEAGKKSCEAEGCTSTTEWALQSSNLTPGEHEVVVRATDGLGNTTSKTLNIETGDTTKPALEVGGELVSAPEGWIEQAEGNYGLHATATDGGYGVTSLVFSLEGKVIASKAQSCSTGACSASISTTVNAHELTAGSHPAEVVATDGAGNSAAKKWNVNVDPEGNISLEEAEATIEAMEETSGPKPSDSESIIGPPESAGSPEVGAPEYDRIPVTETNVPVSISQDPSEGAEFEIADQLVLSGECTEPGNDINLGGGEEAELELEEAGVTSPQACTAAQEAESRQKLEAEERIEEEEVAAGLKKVGLEPITVAPIAVSSSAGDMTPVEGSSTVAPNTQDEVDTVFRPMSEGGYDFESIRSAAAPEHYAYELSLSDEQELVEISPQEVAVRYTEGGPVAFAITALPAHDAIGTPVPTHLAVTGPHVITLTVEHRGPSSAGGSFVYPVMGGTGWEGGYRTISVELAEPPPPPEIPGEETGTVSDEDGLLRTRVAVIGPGVADSNQSTPQGLEPTNPAHWFAFSECIDAVAKRKLEEIEITQVTLEGNCARLLHQEYTWRGTSVRGWAHINSGGWVWINEHPADQLECKKWGGMNLALVHCYVNPQKAKGAITVGGDWRSPPGEWWPFASSCITIYGHLQATGQHEVAQEPIETQAGKGEPCHWPAE